MLHASGQSGNLPSDGLNTHAQLLGLHLLLVEHHLDPDMEEFIDTAIGYAHQLKAGRNRINFELDLDMGRPPDM